MGLTPPPGSTAGPVDMSISLQMYLPEAGILWALLPAQEPALSFRERLRGSAAQAEGNGSPTFQMNMAPFEQGMAMGALSSITCQFQNGLRVRIKNAMSEALTQAGAPSAPQASAGLNT